MNPTIRIQHANGACTNFELDERVVAREFSPHKLLDLMMALYREDTFSDLTSLQLLPLSGSLAQEWQDARQVAWNEKRMDPTVEWRFQERLDKTTQANGFPLAVVHGNVRDAVFARVVANFFGNASVITGVYRATPQ